MDIRIFTFIHKYSCFREFCLSILSVLFKIVTFSALETSHSLACTFYEFVKVCRCFYATNENIRVLSMKFPHLFLRPEIIITFLWGWEWREGQVRHRSPRNSGLVLPFTIAICLAGDDCISFYAHYQILFTFVRYVNVVYVIFMK